MRSAWTGRLGSRRYRVFDQGDRPVTQIVSVSGSLLEQLRAICLALPEALEAGGVGNPSFKVRNKILAM
jgi:hypothetical protein